MKPCVIIGDLHRKELKYISDQIYQPVKHLLKDYSIILGDLLPK